MDKYSTALKGSVRHLDGSPVNMSASNTVTGTIGRALQFNGTDEYISADSNLLTIGNTIGDQITLEALITPDRLQNYIFGKSTNNADYGFYSVGTSPAGVPKFYFNTSTGDITYLTYSGTLNIGTEYGLAIKHEYGDSSKTKIMLNGVEVEGGTWVGSGNKDAVSTSSDASFEIGHWYGTPTAGNPLYLFDGIVDEVHVSNILRSDEWINATYKSNLDSAITYGLINYIPQASPDTIDAIYSNPIYNVSSVGLEVYNLDVSTDYYVAYLTYSGINAVAISNGNLLLGTTYSGILYIPISTISGTDVYTPQNLEPELAVYKQYPNILDNYVKDISACEDYTCVVTASGVDHFNIGNSQSYDHSSGLTAAAEKCFQTCRGRFYYTTQTKTVTIYTHQCDWTEGTVGYEYDSTTSGTLLPAESQVNDICVVEGPVRNNLIFVATSSGVALIEERPGDEANANYKHYFVGDILSGTSNNFIAVQPEPYSTFDDTCFACVSYGVGAGLNVVRHGVLAMYWPSTVSGTGNTIRQDASDLTSVM